MAYLLIRWAILALAIAATAWLMPGVTITGGVVNVLLIAAVFGLVNAIVRPIVAFLTCPCVILTLGLFMLVINTLMFMLTAAIMPALQVDGFWPAFWASLIISIIAAVLNSFVHDESRW